MLERWNLDIYPWAPSGRLQRFFGNYNDTAHYDAFHEETITGYTDGFPTTSPVMSFKPNDLGIYDLSGNVWEFCEDWYNEDRQEHILRARSFRGLQAQIRPLLLPRHTQPG